jgi:hypothetical protein
LFAISGSCAVTGGDSAGAARLSIWPVVDLPRRSGPAEEALVLEVAAAIPMLPLPSMKYRAAELAEKLFPMLSVLLLLGSAQIRFDTRAGLLAGHRRDPGVVFAIGLLIVGGTLVMRTSVCAFAAPQDRGSEPDAVDSRGADNEEDPATSGNDLPAPQNSLDARLRYQTSSGTASRTDRESLILRANSQITLDVDWKLAVLAQLQARAKTTTSNSSGTDREFGIGDAVFQAGLIRTIDTQWAFGFSARLVAPTAEDNLGSGKWQIMPGFLVRYSLPVLGPDGYFMPAIRYAMSFAGDPSRRNISQPEIAPTLNIGLPDRWFVTLFPSYDIRINYGDPVSGQTGRVFLPADVAIGRKITDDLMISLEISVPIIKDYPVYDFKIETRTVFRF